VTPAIISVSRSPAHTFSKTVQESILLLAGLGVEGDAHCGATVRHRYRVRKDPTAPNLCQVHLLHAELFDELRVAGLTVGPGEMGENIMTRGIDLLALPLGTRLQLGPTAVVQVTGLRDPCAQMNGLRSGLMKACIARSPNGVKVRKSGIMAIVITGGEVHAGSDLVVELPSGPPQPLGPV
jgi:MOSC domain-containing protein YiiM